MNDDGKMLAGKMEVVRLTEMTKGATDAKDDAGTDLGDEFSRPCQNTYLNTKLFSHGYSCPMTISSSLIAKSVYQ